MLGYSGLPTLGFYLYGPTVWLAGLELEDAAFQLTFSVALCVVWIAYWWLLLRPHLQIRMIFVRSLGIGSFHILSVALYQIVFGFP